MYLRDVSRRTASNYILSVICTALEFQRFIDVYTYKFKDRKTLQAYIKPRESFLIKFHESWLYHNMQRQMLNINSN